MIHDAVLMRTITRTAGATQSLVRHTQLRLFRLAGKPCVALASFPRSGNTWLRYMVEEATSRLSGSVYHDPVMPRGAYGIVIKTHLLDSHFFDKAIHLVRNPLDAVESYYNYRANFRAVPVDWPQHVMLSILRWRAHTEHWLRPPCPVLRLRYEDLRADPAPALTRVLDWIGWVEDSAQLAARLPEVIARSSIERMRERAQDASARFFREGAVGSGAAAFSSAQLTWIQHELADLLPLLGYELIPGAETELRATAAAGQDDVQ